MKKSWFKDPNAPATLGQMKTIRILLRSKDLTETWLHKGIRKWIKELTMGEADQVIKKLSIIKKQKK